MKLSLRFIQKQLPEKEVLYMRGGSPAILCGQIRFWEEGRKCSRKCIYLISANYFVKCVREKILLPPNLICTASWAALSGIREKTGRFSPDASVLVVSSEHSREYWMNRVQEIFEYYGQLYQNLTDCLLKGESLGEILNCCEELMENPAGLFGRDLRLLGQSKSLMEKKSPNRFWTEAYEQKYVSAELLKLLRESREMEKLNKMERPVLLQGKEFAPYMTGNIVQNGKQLGSISVFGIRRPVEPEDADILQQILPLLAGRMEGEKRRYSALLAREQQYLRDVLDGRIQSADAIGKALSRYPHREEEGLYLLVLEPQKEAQVAELEEYMGNLAEKIVGKCIRIFLERRLVLIFQKTSEEQKILPLLEEQLTQPAV